MRQEAAVAAANEQQSQDSEQAAMRQAALEYYGVLNTPPEAALDRLTALAGKVFGVPIALVSVIGDQWQWFKSYYGLRVTDLDPTLSFSLHTIKTDDVMVVLNAPLDERFSSNPLVTGEPQVRFYAGAPLETAAGLKFGTLCLIDTKPRATFSKAQQVMLKEFAAVVVETLEAQRMARDLNASETRYRVVAETASDAIITIDTSSCIHYANSAVKSIFGYAAEDLLGQDLTLLMPDYLRKLHEAAIARYLETGVRQMHWQAIEIVGLHRDGHEVPIEVSFGEHQDSRRYFTGIMRDISERKRAERALREAHDALEAQVKALEEAKGALEQANTQLLHDAFHDKLTGLANRALFSSRLELALKRSSCHSEQGFAVMYLDSDRFKVINDSLGHAVGDMLLIELGKRLRACVRPGDTVARLGGDEFAILLEDTLSDEEVVRVAERIQREVAGAFFLGQQTVYTSLSIGIVMSHVSSYSADEIVRDADLAMYHAKALGRARHQLFSKAMRDRALELLTLEHDLRGAAERHELRVYYQPITDLASQQIIGFEALVRWQHPSLGLISPAEFIPIVEETGLIVELDRWVLHQGCAQLSSWQRRFPFIPPLTLNVNLSAKQFAKSDFVSWLEHLLSKMGLSPEDLRLEITESVLMQHDREIGSAVKHLRALGVKLYIDDFGTGYSSLSYLQRFPVDSLKIDRSFVKNMGSPESAELVRAILAMAQTLNLGVVAEGIETQTQLEQLRALGCVYGQGYLFAKPLSEKEASKLLGDTANEKGATQIVLPGRVA